MPTNTYVELATTTASASAGPITFTSIPATYTDLVLVVSGTQATSGTVRIQFNNDTASNYSRTDLYGDGTSAASYRESNQTYINFISLQTTQSSSISHILNYANTTTHKTMLTRYNTPSGGVVAAGVTLWRKTPEAIHTITLTNTSNVTGTFSLYGIKAVGGDTGVKALGGTITEDSTYFYHTFKGSSTFTPLQSLSADILVVAGGGGAMGAGGGGGGGGLLGFGSQSLTAQAYPIIVGAGGAGAVPGTGTRTSGNDSKFGSLTTALGGAGGGGYNASAGAYQAALSGGGSGGGGSYYTGISFSAGTAGQGNSGSNGYQGTGGGEPRSGGGGGGAGGAAASGSANVGGNGGIGATNGSTVGGSAGPYSFINAMGAASGTGQLSGGNYYYAGGGGGEGKNVRGEAGLGGGGYGGISEPSTYPAAGTAYTGGGGGAGPNASSSYGGANGGSGVIIVRYLKA